MITYEYPLNERIRTLLRLEDLFEKALYFAEAEGAHEHHVALVAVEPGALEELAEPDHGVERRAVSYT
ncbi:MAG: hypothetical protein N2690_09165, partial [Rhodocyclaceae bacterium]|nr:hypothetical protein [Rhodocyclaceae bacterium]